MHAFGNTQPTNPAFAQPTTRGTYSEPNEVLALDGIIGGIANTNSSLIELLAVVRNYADDLLGGEGSGASSGGNVPPKPNGRLFGLREATSATAELTSELRRQFERIRSF